MPAARAGGCGPAAVSSGGQQQQQQQGRQAGRRRAGRRRAAAAAVVDYRAAASGRVTHAAVCLLPTADWLQASLAGCRLGLDLDGAVRSRRLLAGG